MSGPATGQSKICSDICDALGLKRCRRLELVMAVNNVVTVKAEFFVETDAMEKIAVALKEYHLVENEPPPAPATGERDAPPEEGEL
jgi:hypothetical protein